MAFTEEPATVLYTCVAAFAAVCAFRWWSDPLRVIPTIGGSSLPLLSYIAAARFVRHGKELIQEGYQKYHGSAFKVAMLDQWLVVVSGPKIIDDLRKRPDEEASFTEAAAEITQTKYTCGKEIQTDPYHVEIIRDKLTRTLPTILPDVIDELQVATQEYLPTDGNEWHGVVVVDTMRQIVARASGRVFVGLPLCRDHTYLDVSIDFTLSVVKDRATINLFPKLLKPIVGRLVSNCANSVRRASPLVHPMIEERRQHMSEYGDDWPDKPNDMLQWIMDEALARKHSNVQIIQRLLLLNFAAIHTSSNSVTYAIFHLAERPEYVQPLREEIELIIREDGWTKAAMGRMWKLDSFMKESQRYNGITIISVMRKTQKDITLVDGTFIPRGTLVAADAYNLHHDDAVYANADEFDPWRFARMRTAEGEGMKHQYVNTSVEYVPFGHGKHACPGRFFAANELKALFAYLVLNYDMKLGGDGKRPENVCLAHSMFPAPGKEVLFRKRRAM